MLYIEQETTPNRQAAINGLAVVGFIALIILGIWFAVYSTRFVPAVVSRISAAAVSLGAVFVPAPETTLSVVPNPAPSTPAATSSAPITIPVATTTTEKPEPTPVPVPPIKTQGPKVTQVVPVTPAAPYGLPDFNVTVTAIGYLDSGLSESFVTSTSTPNGKNPAVKFTIKNIGTNWSGTWRFSASVPTQSSYLFVSDVQQSLAPNDSIEYTLGFDRPIHGDAEPVVITVNPDHSTPESNLNNNTVTSYLTVL